MMFDDFALPPSVSDGGQHMAPPPAPQQPRSMLTRLSQHPPTRLPMHLLQSAPSECGTDNDSDEDSGGDEDMGSTA